MEGESNHEIFPVQANSVWSECRCGSRINTLCEQRHANLWGVARHVHVCLPLLPPPQGLCQRCQREPTSLCPWWTSCRTTAGRPPLWSCSFTFSLTASTIMSDVCWKYCTNSRSSFRRLWTSFSFLIVGKIKKLNWGGKKGHIEWKYTFRDKYRTIKMSAIVQIVFLFGMLTLHDRFYVESMFFFFLFCFYMAFVPKLNKWAVK